MFIAFEGIEGCGKSTQSKLLVDRLTKKGFDVVHTREPGGCELGDKLREILLDSKNKNIEKRSELFLYLAARSQHVKQKILPALKQKKIVVIDRFNYSTMAYQGYGRGIDLSFLEQLCDFSSFNIWPDITIVLDIPVEMGIERAKKRNKERMKSGIDESRFEMEKKEFHNRVREGYLKLCERFKEKMILIDGKGDVKTVHERIIGALKNKLEGISD